MSSRISIGKAGEIHACKYLLKNGYRILEKNYRCRIGEIDIVAQKEGTIHFIEVKTRRSINYGMPVESIDARKCRRIEKIAEFYLEEKNIYDTELSFDAITLLLKDGRAVLNHIKNIF